MLYVIFSKYFNLNMQYQKIKVLYPTLYFFYHRLLFKKINRQESSIFLVFFLFFLIFCIVLRQVSIYVYYIILWIFWRIIKVLFSVKYAELVIKFQYISIFSIPIVDLNFYVNFFVKIRKNIKLTHFHHLCMHYCMIGDFTLFFFYIYFKILIFFP